MLSLKVTDQNNNTKVGFYTYPSNMLVTEANVIEIDLTDHGNNENRSFAVVDKRSDQRTSLVLRNSVKDFSFTSLNHNSTYPETAFTLNLIDSSTGNIVCNNNNNYT